MTHWKTLLLTLALATPTLALGGATKLPTYDASNEQEAAKSAKTFKFTTTGKPKTYPKKVVVPYFNVRYQFKENRYAKDSGETRLITLKFSSEQYENLTDQLYHQLVARLEAEGFEVVPREEMLASPAYQALEGDEEAIEGGSKVRHAPTGMTNLATFGSGPKKPGQLAALARELGADAAVSGFANIALCDVEYSGKTKRQGVYACLRGDLTRSGIDIRFFGAAGADKDKPAWEARVDKTIEMYTYNKKEALTYDMALVAPTASMTVKHRFWRKDKLDSDQVAFVEGAGLVYDDALAMAFVTWEGKHGKARAAAGLERRPVESIDDGAPPAVATAPEEPAAPAAPVETGAPALPGEETCWIGTSSSGGLVVRRGVDVAGNRIVEDATTLIEGQPPYRYVTTWTLDGNSAALKEAAGTWTGTATLTGDAGAWTAWETELTMVSGMTVKGSSTLAGDVLSTTSETTSGKKVVGKDEQELTLSEASACQEKLAAVPVPPNAF